MSVVSFIQVGNIQLFRVDAIPTQEANIGDISINIINGNVYRCIGGTGWVSNGSVGGFASPNLYLLDAVSALDANYKGLSYTNDPAEVIVSAVVNSGTGSVLLGQWLFPSKYNDTIIQQGSWIWNYNSQCSANQGDTRLVFEFGMYNDGTQIATPLFEVEGNELNNDYETYSTPYTGDQYTVDPEEYGYIKVHARTTRVNNTTVNLKIGDGVGAFLSAPFALRHSNNRALNEDPNFQHITQEQKDFLISLMP